MDERILQFFEKKPEALPLYAELEEKIRQEIPDVEIRVQKTQISFYKRHMFACV